MDEFMIWFFSLKMDAVVGPWLKEIAMTISFVLALSGLSMVVAQHGENPGAEGAGR